MRVAAMTVAMAMAMESMRRAAEAAIGRAAIGLPSGPGTATLPGPQSRRGTRPIDTAPTAALPINVSTTRRERFMVAVLIPPSSRRRPFYHRGRSRQARGAQVTPACGGSGMLIRRRSQKRARTSRSRHASRCETWNPMTSPRMNGSRRNRCCKSRCAKQSRHPRRHGCSETIRAADIRRCSATAMAVARSAAVRSSRRASPHRRQCPPRSCP